MILSIGAKPPNASRAPPSSKAPTHLSGEHSARCAQRWGKGSGSGCGRGRGRGRAARARHARAEDEHKRLAAEVAAEAAAGAVEARDRAAEDRRGEATREAASCAGRESKESEGIRKGQM